MPPPARLGLVLSRARFVSMNVFGLGEDVKGIGEELLSIVRDSEFCLAAVEVDTDVSDREDTGFIRSFSDCWLDIGCLCKTDPALGFACALDEDPAAGSTIWMGMRLRCGDIEAGVEGVMFMVAFYAHSTSA